MDRLAVYGTLAPGRSNAGQLDGLEGEWSAGHVHGALVQSGWGAHLGYPALVLDPDGPAVEVQVFTSPDLAVHWDRLDRFEGPAYRRVLATVHTATGDLAAHLYELTPEPPA